MRTHVNWKLHALQMRAEDSYCPEEQSDGT